MTYSSPSATVEALESRLIPIWQRALRRPEVGVNAVKGDAVNLYENFFAASGDLWAADRLFAGIAQESGFGRELPSSTIYRAPTIAALASVLREDALPPFCPFVPLKAGQGKPPIFIVHGLAGTVPFYGLAQQIRTASPIYGIQALGLDGMTAPLDRIEDMAQFYLDSMANLPPTGPCILIGYSFGGLVAFEMAQRLPKLGLPVAMLILIDAYPHPRYLSWGQRLGLFVRRAPGRLARWKRKVFGAAMSGSAAAAALQRMSLQQPSSQPLPCSFARTTLSVNEHCRIALEHYDPLFYSGKIKFVKSGGDTYFPADPTPVWKRLSAEFECEIAAGEHLDMVTTNYEGVAAILNRYVTQVSG